TDYIHRRFLPAHPSRPRLLAGYRSLIVKEGFMARRTFLLFTIIMVAVFSAVALSFNIVHAEDGNGWADNVVNLRAGPGTTFQVLSVLKTNAAVVIEARNADTSWVLVHLV